MSSADDAALKKLRLIYGITDARRDPDNGTWWFGSKLRPDLLNLDSPQDAAAYLDRLPQEMIDNLSKPRGSTGNEEA